MSQLLTCHPDRREGYPSPFMRLRLAFEGGRNFYEQNQISYIPKTTLSLRLCPTGRSYSGTDISVPQNILSTATSLKIQFYFNLITRLNMGLSLKLMHYSTHVEIIYNHS